MTKGQRAVAVEVFHGERVQLHRLRLLLADALDSAVANETKLDVGASFGSFSTSVGKVCFRHAPSSPHP
jgi:hypothetical protein